MRIPPAAWRRSRGFAALGLAAAALAVAGIVLAAVLYARAAGGAPLTAQEQLEAMASARRAIEGFAAVAGRLPCPARVRDGPEDCPGGPKGWLPTATLRGFLPPGGAMLQRQPPTRYMVYRGSDDPDDPDLARVSQAYVPAGQDGEPVEDYPGVLSGLDLCWKLRALVPPSDEEERWRQGDSSALPARSDRAHVDASPAGTPAAMNVAYAIAIARADARVAASGINAVLPDLAMESPLRVPDASYGDLVHALDLREAFSLFGCPAAMAAVDGIAATLPLAESANTWRDSNIEDGKWEGAGMAHFILADKLETTSSVTEWLDGLGKQVELQAELDAALAGLPFTALEVAFYTAAVEKNAEATSDAFSDIFIYAGFTATLYAYLGGYEDVSLEAADTTVWDGATQLLQAADTQGTDHAL